MKKINKLLFLFALCTGVVTTSCSEDDNTGDSLINNTKVNVTLTTDAGNNNVIISETLVPIDYTVTATLSEPSAAQIVIDLAQTSGATDGVDIHLPTIIIPAGATSATGIIEIEIPSGDLESDVTFSIGATSRGNTNSFDFDFNITITDYVFCLWTLEMNDAYGDGWQGAFITVNEAGVETEYGPEDFGTTLDIPIGEGYDFSITYTSGTTGTSNPNLPGAPGYEEENSYVLTAPDGTVYSDGPVPSVGIIVEGTNNCN